MNEKTIHLVEFAVVLVSNNGVGTSDERHKQQPAEPTIGAVPTGIGNGES